MLCTEYMDGASLDRYGAIPHNVLKNVARFVRIRWGVCAKTFELSVLLWLMNLFRRNSSALIVIYTLGFLHSSVLYRSFDH